MKKLLPFLGAYAAMAACVLALPARAQVQPRQQESSHSFIDYLFSSNGLCGTDWGKNKGFCSAHSRTARSIPPGVYRMPTHIHDMKPIHTAAVLSNLFEYGVKVVQPRLCDPSNPRVNATYNYANNTLCVNETVHVQSLIHELVHVAQDCAAGGLNTSQLAPMSHVLKAQGDSMRAKVLTEIVVARSRANGSRKLSHVHQATGNQHSFNVELEAYALQDYPSKTVKLFKLFCK